MRVIAGRYRRLQLSVPPGLAVRPTSERLRESVFGVLEPLLQGAHVWDVCAGSGAIGIEALSRGAEQVLFCEPGHAARKALTANLERCRVEAHSYRVWALAWRPALKRVLRQGMRFGIVYFDPPYARGAAGDYGDFLGQLGKSGLAERVLLERPAGVCLPAQVEGLRREREIGRGSSRVELWLRVTA